MINKEKITKDNIVKFPSKLSDLVDFKLLNKKEKNYLFKYHLEVYSKIHKYLNYKERKWLLNLI